MLKLVATVGVLAYIFSIIPFSEVITSLRSVKLSYVFLALLIVLFRCYLRAVQMKRFTDMQALSLSITQIFKINLTTSFYGLFLPGYLAGGAIRWYKFARPENKFMEAMTSIAFNRLVELIVLVSLGVIFWTFNAPREVKHCSIGIVLWIVLAGLFILYFSLFYGRISSVSEWILRRAKLSIVPQTFRNKIKTLLISRYRYQNLSWNLLARIFGFSLFGHLLGAFSFYLFLESLNIHILFFEIISIWSILILVMMMPISFSGLGVREGLLIIFLKPYGVSAAEAVALSLLLYLRTLFLGAIGGLFEVKNLFFLRFDKKEVLAICPKQ